MFERLRRWLYAFRRWDITIRAEGPLNGPVERLRICVDDLWWKEGQTLYVRLRDLPKVLHAVENATGDLQIETGVGLVEINRLAKSSLRPLAAALRREVRPALLRVCATCGKALGDAPMDQVYCDFTCLNADVQAYGARIRAVPPSESA